MLPAILLFDIDGTLLRTGGAGRRAMVTAFERCHASGEACAHFSFGGMTDRAIAREGLSAIGVAATDEAIDALLACYLDALVHELGRAECTLLPGVIDTLARLPSSSAIAVGLGTGNVRRGAELKLQAAGLGGRFSFGGFGCDHELRGELIRVGAERGALQLSRPLRDCRVVVIGDTPRDVQAAHHIGAECVAVATGAHGLDELASCGATLACETLLDTRAQAFFTSIMG